MYLRRRVFLLVLAVATTAARATVYDIGPGQAYTSLGAFAFEDLQAGDTLNIHYQATPYHEKIRIRAQGTPEMPVTIHGVPGPGGERPVLDGMNATTRDTDIYSYAELQDLGLVIIYRGPNDQYGYKPHDIVFEGLELRNGGLDGGNLTDATGLTRTWAENASGIWALGIENVTLRNLSIHNCGNGLFIASKGDEETQSRNLLIERNEIFNNSVPNRYFEHNIYTEAENITFQYNYLGPIKDTALGGNLKDRSARTIVRYNWIQGGQRLIDLVEAQDSYPFVGSLDDYGDDYVYGNILVTNTGDAGALVHYGGDSGETDTYRKRTLHAYNNTFRILRDQSELYRTNIFDLTSNDQSVDARNNIFYAAPHTAGQPATNLQLLINAGHGHFGINWASPGWQPWVDNGTPITGTIEGTENFVVGPTNDPGFSNIATGDLHLLSGSPCIDVAGPLDTAAAANFPMQNQYVVPRDGETRVTAGAAADLGAYEFGAEGEGEGEGEGESSFQSADQNNDNKIVLTELLRVIQFYNLDGLHCADVQTDTEDGYAPGPGANHTCATYTTDYNPQDWQISLSEVLRVIQFYNAGAYHYCPLDGTEDGFCPET